MNKFKIGDTVTLHVGVQKLRWCKILTIKETENGEYKHDLLCNNIRLYDIDSSHLSDIGDDATSSALLQVA